MTKLVVVMLLVATFGCAKEGDTYTDGSCTAPRLRDGKCSYLMIRHDGRWMSMEERYPGWKDMDLCARWCIQNGSGVERTESYGNGAHGSYECRCSAATR